MAKNTNVDTEELKARAEAFMEENGEFVEDPSTSSAVLSRILIQGADLYIAWNEGAITPLLDELTEASDAYSEALGDSTLPPKELKKRELEYQRLDRERNALLKDFGRLEAFMEQAQELYHSKLGGEELDPLAEHGAPQEFLEISGDFNAREAEPKPWWKKFLGA